MAAGKHGSSEITISYDDGPGGTLRAVTNFILTMGAIKITANTQPSHAYGDSWEEVLPTGMSKVDALTLTGYWDDTLTTGPHVVFGVPDSSPQAATRTLRIVFGNAKQFDVETYLVSYAVIGNNGQLTGFEAGIQPTGAGVWT